MKKLGITRPAEWLFIAPSRYVDYANETTDFGDLAVGIPCLVKGTVCRIEYFQKGVKAPLPQSQFANATRLEITLANDDQDLVSVQVFGRPYYAWKHVAHGSEVLVRAIPKLNFRAQFELQSAELVPRRVAGRIYPVYPSLGQIKGSVITSQVSACAHLRGEAAQIIADATGWLDPKEPISYAKLTSFETPIDFLRALHSPQTLAEAERAQRAARRVSAFALVRATHLRRNERPRLAESSIKIDENTVRALFEKIPFALTGDQRRASLSICEHLADTRPLRGLLTGDVGTGKTIAYLIPAVAAHLFGARVVVMTPNLSLINSLEREVRTYFPDIPIATVTGTGIKGDLTKGLVIGNTALLGALKKGHISAGVDFMIVDEQHKFSLDQRSSLTGPYTNILEASATPVPRTTALITHGDSDVFTLRDRPFKRNITTRIVTQERALEARNAVLRAILHKKEQAAVVYPLVSSEDEDKARQTVAATVALWERYIPGDRIAVLHGKLTPDEKEATLAAIRRNERDLIIASTVIEVGLTLPSLKTMLVIDADRMGAVTLHQLRGRLSRHGGEGEMIMHAREPSDEAMRRLELLVQHDDGFTLAEKDAEIRGFGDLLSTAGATQRGKTRTLFLGVEVGPREIGIAADRYHEARARPGQALGSAAVLPSDSPTTRPTQAQGDAPEHQSPPGRLRLSPR